MADTVAIAFPIPPVGEALNSVMRVNLDAIVLAINNISNGLTNFNQLNIGTPLVSNGFVRWYSVANSDYFEMVVGNNRNLTAAGTAFALALSHAGDDVLLSTSNTDNTSSGSNAILRALVGGASSGDPYVLLGVTGVRFWALGLDNSDSDKLEFIPAASSGGIMTQSPAMSLDISGNAVLAGTLTTTGVTASGLTASRALTTNGSSALAVSATTATELAFVSGVTSAIQTQLNAKAPLASPTFTGTVVAPTIDVTTISHSGGTALAGANTNSSAAAGDVGEYVESIITTQTNFPSAGTFGDLTSISLTAGDWDIYAHIVTQANGATNITAMRMGINNASGTSTTGLVTGDNRLNFSAPDNTGLNSCATISFRVTLSGTTTYYLKYSSDYLTATPRAIGKIWARRRR